MRCFSIRQRYNLKANHNMTKASNAFSIVVFQYVKDTIWKQITTLFSAENFAFLLFFNTSKIQFESKSQLKSLRCQGYIGCFSIRQRYNLKANHNLQSILISLHHVVFQYVKDTIWKQITTCTEVVLFFYKLFFNTSKIQFESKSQQLRHRLRTGCRCFSIRQRYNLKANHNYRLPETAWYSVVFQYVKDTIWKQITTSGKDVRVSLKLFFNTSKIQFESKSQLLSVWVLV